MRGVGSDVRNLWDTVDRELNGEYGPSVWVVSAVHRSVVNRDGLPDHGEPKSRSPALGGKVGLPDLIQFPFGDALTVVPDLDVQKVGSLEDAKLYEPP